MMEDGTVYHTFLELPLLLLSLLCSERPTVLCSSQSGAGGPSHILINLYRSQHKFTVNIMWVIKDILTHDVNLRRCST